MVHTDISKIQLEDGSYAINISNTNSLKTIRKTIKLKASDESYIKNIVDSARKLQIIREKINKDKIDVTDTDIEILIDVQSNYSYAYNNLFKDVLGNVEDIIFNNFKLNINYNEYIEDYNVILIIECSLLEWKGYIKNIVENMPGYIRYNN